MQIHITMQSGAHIKIATDDECNKFLNQWNGNTGETLTVMVDGWKMILVRRYVEAVAIREL